MKRQTLIMSVDLGTTFIKCAAFDISGRCLCSFGAKVEDERPAPGQYIQHGESILASVTDSMRQCAAELGERAGDVGAIVFTGQMAGFMGVGKNWEDITGWSCSMDTRYAPYVDKMISEHLTELREDSGTGCPVTAPKMQWFAADFPEESKKIAKYMMISGFVLGRLCGIDIEEAVIDRSYLEWTGLADLKRDAWSKRLCDIAGVGMDKLPRIVASDEVCGYLSDEMAEVTGMKKGTPLVAGSGDKPAGCIGAGIVDEGDLIIEAASYAGISMCTSEYMPDIEGNRIDIVPAVFRGSYLNHFYLCGSGITLDWFVTNMMGGMSAKEAFKKLEHDIAEIPAGSDGVVAVGMPGGRAMPFSGALRGTWFGYNWTHTVAHFYRALIESYSFEYAATIDRMRAMFPDIDINSIKIVGGGASSDVWNQMNADIIGLPVIKLDQPSMSQWGAALIGYSAIGEIDDLRGEAKKHVNVTKRYEPNMDMHRTYAPVRAKYERTIEQAIKYYDSEEKAEKRG